MGGTFKEVDFEFVVYGLSVFGLAVLFSFDFFVGAS